jgi:hypothetical protein
LQILRRASSNAALNQAFPQLTYYTKKFFKIFLF